MTVAEATQLIRGAVHAPDGTWADFGAGSGIFTDALARLLGDGGRVLAIDNDAAALRDLRRVASRVEGAEVVVACGDVTKLDEIPELNDMQIDAALFANVLHFVRDPAAVLRNVQRYMRPGSQVVVVEYDRRGASRWVPYPLPFDVLVRVAGSAGLSEPVEIARRKSRYQGELYAALIPTLTLPS